MMGINVFMDRKKFIKITAITSAGLLPVAAYLAKELKENKLNHIFDADFNKALNFYIIDNNLLNLHFYFINVKKSGSSLVPASSDTNLKSFMIVRLPQMHLSEKGYWYKNWNDSKERLPDATLSGYSYLAFQLWPDKPTEDKKAKKPHPNKKLRFTLENVLNWNDENNFELITLVEWFDLKKSDILAFSNYKKCDDFNKQKVWHLSAEEVAKEYSEPYYVKESYEPTNSFNYKKYKSLIRHFLDQNLENNIPSGNNFIPITFLEFPQGAILVPIARDETGALAKQDNKPSKQFWQNKFVNQKKVDFGYRKYEVWNNTLFYKTKIKAKEESNKPTFKIETPSFRIAGLITKRDVVCPDLKEKTCQEANEDGEKQNFLPSLLDKTELAFLTQFAMGEADFEKIDFRDKKFDIKESNGLFFTGLGIITHLKYYNEDAPIGIDLIEYEHIITQGRDIFIKVARIGIHNKNGKRYKHVIEGKRKIETEIKDPATGQITYTFSQGATSFIELKQYCECIEKKKNYEFPEKPTKDEWDASNFINSLSASPNPIFQPAISNNSHYRRYSWKEIRTIEKKRIPIEPFQDQTDGQPIANPECALWFWPVLEGTLLNPKYFHSVFDADDWDSGTLNLATPFIFIRKSVIESGNSTEIRNLTNSYFKHISDESNDPINVRRRIIVNNQKIAYTKSLQTRDTSSLNGQELNNALNESKSKTHILETDFIETYFDFSKQSVFTAGNPFAKVRFPLLPQVLRAKVFVDHIRDLTQQKIPSVIEYHENYIKYEFIESIADPIDATKKQYANAAKQILANTDAFIGRKIVDGIETWIEPYEEQANQSYKQIKNALQEAKDKLGNLAVPDIVPDTISLEKFGVTLPKGINDSIAKGKIVLSDASAGLQKIASFNPRELLRGKLSDVCGLDLTAILDELLPAGSDNNQTPLFEINKTLGTIEKVVLESPIYKAIVEGKKKLQIADPLDGGKLKYPQELIEEYEKKIIELRNTIEEERLKVNKKIKELSNEIPNAEELDNLVKSLFEQYRTQAFQALLSKIPFEDIATKVDTIKAEADKYFAEEKNLLKEEFEANRAKLVGFFKEYEKEITLINSLPDLIKAINGIDIKADEIKKIDGIDIKDYLTTKLKPYYDTTDFCGFSDKLKNLFDTIPDTKKIDVAGEVIYYVIDNKKSIDSITYELTKDSNKGNPLLVFNDVANGKFVQVENKVNTLKAFVVKNINGNSFQQKAATQIQSLVKNYTLTLDKAEKEVKKFQNDELGKISSEIENWKNRSSEYLKNAQNISAEAKDALIKVQGIISKGNPYLDILRKCDPYFYYLEQQRLKKEIDDVEMRFKEKYFSWYLGKKNDVEKIVNAYKIESKKYSDAIADIQTIGQDKLNEIRTKFIKYRSDAIDKLNKKSDEIIQELIKSDEFKELKKIFDELNTAKAKIQSTEDDLKKYILNYKSILQQQATDYAKQLDQKVKDYIDEQENKLIDAVGADNILAIQENINEAKNIYLLLTSIKQQDLTYKWSTDRFRDINFGIVSFKKFSNPDTTLKVDVKATTYFTSGKFPPVVEKVVTYSENRFTNFGISFFNCLTVGFNEISFIAGSDRSTHFDVKIKDVKFDGALSFVQAFEKWLQTMGKGLILQVHGDHAALGYSLAIPAIKTPGFNIFNLSLNFDLRVYFDKRPLRFGFSLARPDSKFGIAVGIYAGFGFFGIVADPKKGIVEIDCALEAGAWAGISFGPFSGEVKLAFGFRYTKNEFGVRIEGYIVAEGRLSFWIIEVAARIYLGVVSENSYVEGVCTVTYSVKIGFIKKSFSGSFHKKIAGAKSNNSENSRQEIVGLHETWQTPSYLHYLDSFPAAASSIERAKSVFTALHRDLKERYTDKEEEVIEPVGEDEWEDFVTIF